MELSFLVAKMLAIVYISAGIAAVSGKITFSRIVEDFEKSQGLTFISGFMTLVMGMLLVHYHNIWVKDWTVLITIVAWMSLLKGIMLIVFPQSISSFKGLYKNTRMWGIFMIAIGLLFAYFGFVI
jgi:predicted MFS family arabinose efflux permease